MLRSWPCATNWPSSNARSTRHTSPAQTGIPSCTPAPPSQAPVAPVAVDRLPRHHPALAPRPHPGHHAKITQRKRPGRPPTRRAIAALVQRLARENPPWDTGASTANSPASASTSHHDRVGDPEDPRYSAGPGPRSHHLDDLPTKPSQSHHRGRFRHRDHVDRASYYVFAVIEHATRQVRILGPPPTRPGRGSPRWPAT